MFFLVSAFTVSMIFAGLSIHHSRNFNTRRFSGGVNTIFIGDSHIKLGVSVQQNSSSVNLSQNAESYKFSYLKLKRILANNPQIRNVYLGYSYQNISSYYDNYVHGKGSLQISSRYFFISPVGVQINSLIKNKSHLIEYTKSILTNGIRDLLNSNAESYMGSYENNFGQTRADRFAIRKRIRLQYYKGGEERGFSSSNLKHLALIKDLCQDKNVSLTLIRTPLHANYKKNVPEKFKRKFQKVISENQLQLIVVDGEHLTDSCFTPDGDHLSQEGAEMISSQGTQLNELLN